MGQSFVLILVMVVAFYFLLIRPQKKRDKEAKDMLAAIKKGDKIVTIGGIRGTIAAVKETTVVVKVDDNTKIEFNKTAISSVLSKSAAPAAVEAPAKKASKKAEEVVAKPEEKVEEVKAEEVKEEVKVEEVKAPAKKKTVKKAEKKEETK